MFKINDNGMVAPCPLFLGRKLHIVSKLPAQVVIPAGKAHKRAILKGQVHVCIQHIRRKGFAQGCHGLDGGNFQFPPVIIAGDLLQGLLPFR